MNSSVCLKHREDPPPYSPMGLAINSFPFLKFHLISSIQVVLSTRNALEYLLVSRKTRNGVLFFQESFPKYHI